MNRAEAPRLNAVASFGDREPVRDLQGPEGRGASFLPLQSGQDIPGVRPAFVFEGPGQGHRSIQDEARLSTLLDEVQDGERRTKSSSLMGGISSSRSCTTGGPHSFWSGIWGPDPETIQERPGRCESKWLLWPEA